MSKSPRSTRAAKRAPVKSRKAPQPPEREPLRYAHPFFTSTPVAQRPVSLETGTKSMAQFASKDLGPIPAPSPSAATMNLEDIIGASGVAEIKSVGSIGVHAVGDTGRPAGVDTAQEEVSEAMASDFNVADRGRNPALLFHLGDVIYGHDKDKAYRDEFYRPYMKYPGKIIAIPGNHDGEVYKITDPVSLKAFRDNFCTAKATVPEIASEVRIFRETMTQPGVYWLLSAPFINIIGLYSNVAEGPGNLLGAGNDDKQLKWLVATLAGLKNDPRALVIATHHPPYSSGGHTSSKDMLAQIDKACEGAGTFPHAMLAGHSHNYQRYTRSVTSGGKTFQIPSIVAGCGGHADSAVTAAHGQSVDNAVFENSMKGYGYLMLTANGSELTIEMFATTDGSKSRFDGVTVDLASRRTA